jgi:potassium-dependent mechanosensitive channel
MTGHRNKLPGSKRSDREIPMRIKQVLGFLIAFTFFGLASLRAQKKEQVQNPPVVDTSKNEFINSVKSAGEQSMSKFRMDKIAARQDQILEEIKKTNNKAKDYLKKDFDTAGMSRDVREMESTYQLAIDGVFVHLGRIQTHRNLETTDKILSVIKYGAENLETKLDRYQNSLVNFRYHLDSLTSDTVFNLLPTDSIELATYLKKILIMRQEVKRVDSALNLVLLNFQETELKIGNLTTNLSSDLEAIENYRDRLTHQSFNRELPNLWKTATRTKPFDEILHFSLLKGNLAFFFYLKENIFKCIFLILVVIILTSYLLNLKRIYAQRSLLDKKSEGQLVLRHPFLSSLMISVSLLQFIFIDPPYSFNAACCLVSSICLTIIFRNYVARFWMNFWIMMLIMFTLASAMNMLLEASRDERWLMLILSVSALSSCIFFMLSRHKKELKEKWIVYFMAFVVLLEAGSIVANLFGRYNLSKTLLVSGILNVVIGVLLLWTIRLINEALSLGANVYASHDKKFLYINFERLGRKVPPIFYFFLVIGWFILITRNVHIFKLISEPFWDFLVAERKIGSYVFTIYSLIIFIVIMIASTLISRIVSFFASSSDSRRVAGQTAKPGVGSWILLVRIAIMSLGLFLAFAAAGIPMDKITIILGALGVGIGFGLQSLVNNLVSGLIIAFEKPVNVGDIVEVGGKSGTMKAIGFRSSIITTPDGAEVIMPNGELLNSHLVNWTLSNTSRGVEIALAIAYGTDLGFAKQVLDSVLKSNENVLKYPEPSVMFKNFGESSITVTVSFWVLHVSQAPAVKSEIISAIYSTFKEQGIVIPFPQQDLHVQIVGGKTE